MHTAPAADGRCAVGVDVVLAPPAVLPTPLTRLTVVAGASLAVMMLLMSMR